MSPESESDNSTSKMHNDEEGHGVGNVSKVTKRRKVNLALRVNKTIVVDRSVQPFNNNSN